MSSFPEQLNEQVTQELAAHQQYVAIAIHYDAEALPRLAAFFYRQALEERNHALMMVRHLLDSDHAVAISELEAPHSDFDGVIEPVALALGQEKRVTDQINALAAQARDEGDYAGEQFMQWFIAEQVEEVATMSDLLKVVERAGENPLLVEEYLAREAGDGDAGPTPPPVAGGAL